jgi:hypothetical protein
MGRKSRPAAFEMTVVCFPDEQSVNTALRTVIPTKKKPFRRALRRRDTQEETESKTCPPMGIGAG